MREVFTRKTHTHERTRKCKHIHVWNKQVQLETKRKKTHISLKYSCSRSQFSFSCFFLASLFETIFKKKMEWNGMSSKKFSWKIKHTNFYEFYTPSTNEPNHTVGRSFVAGGMRMCKHILCASLSLPLRLILRVLRIEFVWILLSIYIFILKPPHVERLFIIIEWGRQKGEKEDAMGSMFAWKANIYCLSVTLCHIIFLWCCCCCRFSFFVSNSFVCVCERVCLPCYHCHWLWWW